MLNAPVPDSPTTSVPELVQVPLPTVAVPTEPAWLPSVPDTSERYPPLMVRVPVPELPIVRMFAVPETDAGRFAVPLSMIAFVPEPGAAPPVQSPGTVHVSLPPIHVTVCAAACRGNRQTAGNATSAGRSLKRCFIARFPETVS